MAFADYDAYVDALAANIACDWQMTVTAVAVARFGNYTMSFVPTIPGLPSTPFALDKTNLRAINGFVQNADGGRMSILAGRMNPSGVGGVALMIVDLLCINGGLSGVVTTDQTTNLPTAPLPRYTSGVGVHAALAVYTNVGTTVTTATVSYTNQSGEAGRISTAVPFGGTANREVGALIRIPLQAGDTGIQSVESVKLTASTATAGNFGVILYKPLALMFVNDVEGANVIDCVSSGRMVGQMNEVQNDACLTVFGNAATASQAVSGFVLLGEA